MSNTQIVDYGQHFRLEIQFLQNILIYRLGFSPKFLKLIPSIKKISFDCIGVFWCFSMKIETFKLAVSKENHILTPIEYELNISNQEKQKFRFFEQIVS
jgi:hypothetical protein